MRSLLYISFVLILPWMTFPIVSGQDIYEVTPMPFNSRAYNDFSPVYYRDGLVFCSDRAKGLFKTAVMNDNFESQLDIFIAKSIDSVSFGSPQAFSGDLNTRKFEGPVCFSSDWNTIYFTRNFDAETGRRRKDNPNFGIFTAQWDGSLWTNILPFVYNDPKCGTGHPSLSPDGQFLFFASDRPGGFGKSDLYMCKRQDDGWGPPVNLGNIINTPGDESFPFIHRSGRLYYASDGPKSGGKLDIFYAIFSDGSVSDVTRLNEPFNTDADDFGFIADEYLENGFFSSNRRRTDNIYRFTTLVKRYAGCAEVQENEHTYTIREPNAYLLDTLHHIFEWDLGDGNKKRGIEVEHTYREAGMYIIKLNVIDSLTGEVLYNQATYDLPIEDIEQVYITCPDTCYVNEEITLDGKKSNLPDFYIQGYLWNFGDGTYSTEAEVTHVFKSPGVFNVQLVVESMPDPGGTTKKHCGCRNIVVLPGRRR